MYNSIELYYTPPSDELFEEVKAAAIRIWETYDNTYGYVDEKVNRIKDIPNVSDNFMYIVAMFDTWNQKRLVNTISEDAIKAISDRYMSGYDPHVIGETMELNPFFRK